MPVALALAQMFRDFRPGLGLGLGGIARTVYGHMKFCEL